jgi:tetratricopeptide (TPR) repeat protein
MSYWEYLKRMERIPDRVEELAAKIKRNPGDIDSIFEYVAARSFLPQDQRPPATWLAETCRLERAIHNFALGQTFRWEKPPEAAIRFYDRSLACPLTDYDRRHFNEFSGWAMHVWPDQAEEILREATKEDLAAACLEAKKLDRAQRLVEELTAKREGERKRPRLFFGAGQVEAASGQRVVEARLIKAEEESKASISYWLNRAEYHKGRKKLDKAEQAYQAAIKLPADAANTWHFEAVRDYGWLLAGQKRFRDAEGLYGAELKRIGPKDTQADFWINQLRLVEGK